MGDEFQIETVAKRPNKCRAVRRTETLKQISKVGRMKRFGKYCDFVRTSKFNGGADLAVESHEVIDIQSGSADGLKSFYPGMRSVPIVVV